MNSRDLLRRRTLRSGLALLLGLAALPLAAWWMPARAQDPVEIRIGHIGRAIPPKNAYEVDSVPQDEGLAGARMAIRDNNTTGAFTGRKFVLDEAVVDEGESAVEAARSLAEKGAAFIALDLAADDVLAVADALKDRPVTLFNTRAPDDRLRGAECRANLMHTAPSRAMLTDALAQFLAFKRWRKIFLVVGPQEADRLYAEAVKRSARKFGLAIAAEKTWDFGPLARAKTDSPSTAEALVFTRGVDYDIVIVTDEAGDFGDYIPFRTWDPRPVAGTQGLVATSWHPTLEAFGAAQAQNRFSRLAGRSMRAADYQAWAAVRSVGEAAARGAEAATIKAQLTSPSFSLPGYKGVAMSYRPWDRQLRQPILVAQPRALVDIAPQAGFLHQRTPLDTLGADEPESACKLR
jgi:ABC transporter substrate binding protein (PQQ-dependent alcohol dehydrogenase system)